MYIIQLVCGSFIRKQRKGGTKPHAHVRELALALAISLLPEMLVANRYYGAVVEGYAFTSYVWLVVWNINFIFPYLGNVIIPIDFHIF